MGRSDPIIFQWYIDHMYKFDIDKIAFLGFNGENSLTNAFNSDEKDFYDLSLGNWNINDDSWNIDKTYDLIVCTRCAYFSKNPKKFIKNCHAILNDGGRLFVDWGLGDHWRFENYKIGWVKDGEHEFCYGEDNFLWSTIWHDICESHEDFKKFSGWVKKFGYDNVKQSIFEEVPSVLLPEDFVRLFKSTIFDMISLWEESPQLYILVNCIK